METEKKMNSKELKHLGFVRMVAVQTLVCVSNLYDYAKQNSGPLRSTVGTVETAVTTVVGPVYQKFKDLPDHLLVFVDNKVDEGTQKFDKHAPPVAKQVASQAQTLMQVALQKVQELVNEARVGGARAAVHFAAKESKHLALTQSVKVWIKLNQFPAVHTVADMAVPTAAHWSEKYNHVIKDMTQKGHTLFGYLPLVPVDEIAKAFKQGKTKAGEKANVAAHQSDSSDSD
ncbi:REF/SRPP-like protein At1g67360 [Ricinus communis]|uniref:Small rubber particle protein, putative n=1 Tax=Ricinus communis TaxID=3988 RepID=B9RME8_RICCO|nr:REF/SRPP-like protein At1g67360 [Ricinus communis]EEF47471.1 Small rubber particle protein, putative [Ricinus communis]|eukprot:XP_002514917.1 REF/SRPP-like protein At1g67360 [Ricinus communis]